MNKPSTDDLRNLTELQSEALKEILNMGAGRAAASLEALTGEYFTMLVPEVSIYSAEELEKSSVYGENYRSIMLHVGGDLNGFTSMVFSIESAKRLLSNVLDEEPEEEDLDLLVESALMELGNVVVGAIVGVFANALELNLEFSTPTLLEGSIGDLVSSGAIGKNPQIIVAKIKFIDSVGTTKGYFVTVFDLASMGVVIPSLDTFLKKQGLI